MRLLLIVLAAGTVSLGIAFALVYAASHWLPCYDDPASCGMGEVYGVIGTLFYAPCAMLAFGITLWRKRSERAIGIATFCLLVPIAAIVLFGMSQNGTRLEFREFQGALQFFVPLTLTVVLQWLILRTYLRWQAG
jgi:hypothetical protein